jgi:hypothetical protein
VVAGARPYLCPLCDEDATVWLLYPALGRPICDDCDVALTDDDATFAAACAAFDLSPTLLLQIVEQQRPLRLSAFEATRRFG